MLTRLPPYLKQLQSRYLCSFRNRLTALSLGVCVTLLWTQVFFSVAVQKQQISEVLSDQQFASVQQLANELNAKLEDRTNALVAAAARVPARLEEARLDAYLAQLSGLEGIFSAGIVILDLDGKALADYPAVPNRRGTNYADRGYVEKVKATRQPYIGPPVIGRTLQRPILTISVPVFDRAGNPRAILAGITDLTAPNFLGSISNRALAGKGEFFIISPHDNLFVAATDTARAMTALPAPGQNLMLDRFRAGFEGSGLARSSAGEPHLYSAKHVPASRWLVVAGLPAEVAFKPVVSLRNRLVVVAGLLTILAIFVTHRLTRRIVAPIDAAGKAMQQIAAGTAPLARLPVKGKDEIGGLVDNVNALIEKNHLSQAALTDSEARFRTLVDNAPDAIFVQTEGCFAYVNAAGLRLFGAGCARDLVGQPVLDRIHPDMRAAVAARIHRLNEVRENAPPLEEKIVRLDGETVHVEVSATPYYYANRNGALVFARNIDHRKRMEAALRDSENRFQRLVALSTEWYWEQDEQHRFTRLFGWGSEQTRRHRLEFIGHTRWEMTPEMGEEVWRAHRAPLVTVLPRTHLESMRCDAQILRPPPLLLLTRGAGSAVAAANRSRPASRSFRRGNRACCHHHAGEVN